MFSTISSWLFRGPSFSEPILGVNTAKQVRVIYSSALLALGIYEDDILYYLEHLKQQYPWFSPIVYQTSHNKHAICFANVVFEDYICLVIRGSVSLEDWVVNIDAIPQSPSIFHRGFESRVKLIPLKHIWEYSKVAKKPLILCGHSQGGAIAQLCAVQLLNSAGADPGMINCITFGSPLVATSDQWPKICSQWPDVFSHYIMAGDPVPVVLRKAPYNFFPAGKIFLLTRNEIGGKCSAISVRDYDSALADNNLQIPNLQNILQHCVKHYVDVISMLARNVKFSQPQNVWLKRIDIVPHPSIKTVEGTSDPSGKIEIHIQGEHLSSLFLIGLNYSSMNGGNETIRRVYAVRLQLINQEKIHVEFLIPRTTMMVKSAVQLDATNGYHFVVAEGSIPFRRVLLIGQTGAGKTLLKAALIDRELGLPPHTEPRSTAHTKPQHQEKIHEGNLIAYEEWLGFVHSSPAEFEKALNRAFSDPPMVIICVINADGTLLVDYKKRRS
jgi:hypothetical protein